MKICIKSIIIVTATLFLAACSQESVENDLVSQKPISFNVPDMLWNEAATRAQVFGSIEDLKASTTDIRVTAKYHNDHDIVYINNERLQYLDNVWTLTKEVDNTWIPRKYYWLPNTSLDFFADVVSGNRNDFTVSNTTKYTFDYTVPTAIASQHDYIYAVSLDQSRDDDGVPLEFKHALSQIVFTGSVAENWNVTIKSITIKNISSAGTFSYETGLWTNLDTQDKTYVLTLATPKVFNGQSQPEELLASSSEPYERLVLMPQTLNPWIIKDNNDNRFSTSYADEHNQSYVIIECKIQEILNNNYIVGDDTSYGTIYASLSGTWEPNKKYIYNLPFGAGYDNTGHQTIQQITLSSTIVDWTIGNTESGQALFD